MEFGRHCRGELGHPGSRMRLRALLLADAIVLNPDGKAVIIGAGVDRIMASQFPWALAQLAVFISYQSEGQQDTIGTEHDLRVTLRGPNSQAVAELGGPFRVSAANPEGETVNALQNAALIFQQVQLPAEGLYSVEVTIDGSDPESVPLLVVHGESQAQWSAFPTAVQPG
jgi:hypothetical protein